MQCAIVLERRPRSGVLRIRFGSMTAVVDLIPYDDRGREIIEELEGIQEPPVEIRHYGHREYYARAENLGLAGFDAMLDRIDPSWREHLGRTA
jgi:hypothetical protein